ncbi:MAG: DegT/DnrJ/EryC1/StrS family aminotransferase [Bryobacterales bacterium]|nr:DegT/DnrJ/EryC1/StrS family aminotransferase [Bryobacterales bacterium]
MIELPGWPIADGRETELLQEVLRSPQWGGFNPLVGKFEDAFAAYQGASFGISAVNGTVTLEMMLACAGIGPGDEVIVPAISFVSTASAVTRVGAVPVFVDIEPYSFNMCPAAARAAAGPRTRALLAVHFGGSMADVDALGALCAEKGLLFFEDAAHAHGSEWKGKRAGSFGLASSFSFQNGKILTAGEGGMVLTSDEELAGKLRSYANQGRRPGYSFFHHFEAGNNYRLSALHAAVLTAGLERLDGQIEKRARNWEVFRGEVGEEIRWQSIPGAVNRNSWYLVLGRVVGGDRNGFCKRVQAEGIPCTPFYPHPLYGNPMYGEGGAACRVEACPNTEVCIGDAFWIGFRALMGDAETTRRVARAVRAAI